MFKTILNIFRMILNVLKVGIEIVLQNVFGGPIDSPFLTNKKFQSNSNKRKYKNAQVA